MMKYLIVITLLIFINCSNITHITTSNNDPAYGQSAIVYNNKLWLFSGSNSTSNVTYFHNSSILKKYYYSENGINWTSGSVYKWNVGGKALKYQKNITTYEVLVSGGEYSPFTDKVPRFENIMYKMTNDTPTFSSLNFFPENKGRSWFAFIRFKNKFWILGGCKEAKEDDLTFDVNNKILTNQIWSSDDGITWNEISIDTSQIWSPREGHSAIVVNDKLYIIGGRTIKIGYDENNNEISYYETEGDVWSTTNGTNWTRVNQTGDEHRWEAVGRAFHQVVQLGNHIYLIGGISQTVKHGTESEVRAKIYKDIQRCTISTNWESNGMRWIKMNDELPIPVFKHAALVKNDKIFVIGGRGRTNVYKDVVIYNP